MDALTALLVFALTVVNLTATSRILWQAWRQWGAPPAVHPLDAPLKEIAAAIRKIGDAL